MGRPGGAAAAAGSSPALMFRLWGGLLHFVSLASPVQSGTCFENVKRAPHNRIFYMLPRNPTLLQGNANLRMQLVLTMSQWTDQLRWGEDGFWADLTVPLVFFKTVAANSWVTPTRLMPSTSTIWSFTCMLERQETARRSFISLLFNLFKFIIITIQ